MCVREPPTDPAASRLCAAEESDSCTSALRGCWMRSKILRMRMHGNLGCCERTSDRILIERRMTRIFAAETAAVTRMGRSAVTASALSRRFDIRSALNGGQLNLTGSAALSRFGSGGGWSWWSPSSPCAGRGGAFSKCASDVRGEDDTGASGTECPTKARCHRRVHDNLQRPGDDRPIEATTKIPEDVTFEARTVAASPILSIEATANSPEVAQDAAEQMAKAFRADINSIRQRGAETTRSRSCGANSPR